MGRRLLLVLACSAAFAACSVAYDFDDRVPRDGLDAGEGAEPETKVTKDASGPKPAETSTPTGKPADGGPAEAGSADAGPAPECPGTAGPKPVKVGAYCIDATEVTNADFAKFVADTKKVPVRPPGCEANVLEAQNFPGANQLPVVRVDWCTAFAFCKWAGKRLCGKIGGGAADNATQNNQWFSACSADGKKKYPYGDNHDDDTCQTDGEPLHAVGAVATCVGGSPGIVDMSGNAAEWEDSCTGAGPGDGCSVRGGDADEGDDDKLTCAFAGRREPRNKKDPLIGFRCCTP